MCVRARARVCMCVCVWYRSADRKTEDAPDAMVKQATNGALDSCADVQDAGLCTHALASDACPRACALAAAPHDDAATAVAELDKGRCSSC